MGFHAGWIPKDFRRYKMSAERACIRYQPLVIWTLRSVPSHVLTPKSASSVIFATSRATTPRINALIWSRRMATWSLLTRTTLLRTESRRQSVRAHNREYVRRIAWVAACATTFAQLTTAFICLRYRPAALRLHGTSYRNLSPR